MFEGGQSKMKIERGCTQGGGFRAEGPQIQV
jgi:hypothetical protein